MSGYDMRRAGAAFSHFFNEGIDMRSGLNFRETTCPTTGLSFSIREEWIPDLFAGLCNGISLLSIMLPWVLRNMDSGINMSAETCTFIHNMRSQAVRLDAQEREIKGGDRWVTVVDALHTIASSTGNGVPATQWTLHCTSAHILRWWTMPTTVIHTLHFDQHRVSVHNSLTI